jgi:hypothetical protein
MRKAILLMIGAMLFAMPAWGAEEIWHCLRAGTDTPDTAISEIGPRTCASYLESSVSASGTKPGSIFMVLGVGAEDDSAWITIPELPGYTVELNFVSDTTAATIGTARIQVRHSTDLSTLGDPGTNGSKILLGATLTGEDPYATITGIKPGQIKVMTTADASAGEAGLIELRVIKGD